MLYILGTTIVTKTKIGNVFSFFQYPKKENNIYTKIKIQRIGVAYF